MVSKLALALCAVSASAFVAPAPKVMAPSATAVRSAPGGFMESASAEFNENFPAFNSYGWGVSTKAERWNGRHAMFGWFFIICTGYAQGHHLIPDPDQLLNFKEWGTLAVISGGKGGGLTITNERAIVLIANVHFLMVSLCAAFCPLPFQDTLLLEPGEPDEAAAGLVPAFDTGLTPAAELWNGRLAMLGLVVFASYSMIYNIPFLEGVDGALGGLLLHPAGVAQVAAAVADVAAAAP